MHVARIQQENSIQQLTYPFEWDSYVVAETYVTWVCDCMCV